MKLYYNEGTSGEYVLYIRRYNSLSKSQGGAVVISEIEEKRLLLDIIGTLEAVKRKALHVNEAEKFLFSPYMVSLLKEQNCNHRILLLLEKGCELEDILSLLPDRLEQVINELEDEAMELLKEYPKFEESHWI